jgi:hypothetical protein
MGLRTALVDCFFVARLDGTVGRDEVDRIVTEARESARSAGKRVVYCGVNAPGVELPDAEMRAYIMKRAYDLLEHASSLEIVMEGDGIKSSLLRTAVRGMITLGRTRRPGPARAFIHADVRSAIERTKAQLSLSPDEVERRLRDVGIVH